MSCCIVIVNKDHIVYYEENEALSSALIALNTEYCHSVMSKFNENGSKLAYLIQNQMSIEEKVECYEITLPITNIKNNNSNTKRWTMCCLNKNDIIISIICCDYNPIEIKLEIRPLLNKIYTQFIQNFMEITNVPLYIMRIRCKSFIEPILKKHCSYKWRRNLCCWTHSKTKNIKIPQLKENNIELEIINKPNINKEYISFPTYNPCVILINNLYDTQYISCIKLVLNLSQNISKIQFKYELNGISDEYFDEITAIYNHIETIKNEFNSVEQSNFKHGKWKDLQHQFVLQCLRIKHISIDIIEQCKRNFINDKHKLIYYDKQLIDMLKLELDEQNEQKYESNPNNINPYIYNQYNQPPQIQIQQPNYNNHYNGCNCYSCNQYKYNQNTYYNPNNNISSIPIQPPTIISNERQNTYISPFKNRDINIEFFLYTYKCQPCLSKTNCQSKLTCPGWHCEGEKRRNPGESPNFIYSEQACSNVKLIHTNKWHSPSMCTNDNECKFSHTNFEQMYHPNVYKTQMCIDFSNPQGNKCQWGFYCEHAHGYQDIRYINKEKEMKNDEDIKQENKQSSSIINEFINKNDLIIHPIWIDNLPSDITISELRQFIQSEIGCVIVSIHICKKKHNDRTYAFINLPTAEKQLYAVTLLDNKIFKQKKLIVRPKRPTKFPQSFFDMLPISTQFKQFRDNVVPEILANPMINLNVRSVRMILEQNNINIDHLPHRLWNIKCELSTQCNGIYCTLYHSHQEKELGRIISILYAQSCGEMFINDDIISEQHKKNLLLANNPNTIKSKHTLLVKGLARNITSQKIEDTFESFGIVDNVIINPDNTCYVRMKHSQDAKKNVHLFKNNSAGIIVNFAPYAASKMITLVKKNNKPAIHTNNNNNNNAANNNIISDETLMKLPHLRCSMRPKYNNSYRVI
eukprot:230475_1